MSGQQYTMYTRTNALCCDKTSSHPHASYLMSALCFKIMIMPLTVFIMNKKIIVGSLLFKYDSHLLELHFNYESLRYVMMAKLNNYPQLQGKIIYISK